MSLPRVFQLASLLGEPVTFSPWLPRSTMAVRHGWSGGWIFFSETAFNYSYVGVVWHDESEHCPTWSQGCRCDVEPT